MNTTKITCSIGTTDPSAELGLEVWLDDDKLVDIPHIIDTIEFEHNLSDEEGNHNLRFVMKNKTHKHTVIDEAGDIIKDACLTISRLAVEDVPLEYVFLTNAVYTHDFNGDSDIAEHKFFGEMGCNGTVSLPFATPTYLWLLENM